MTLGSAARAAAFLFCTGLATTSVLAQCAQWAPGGGVPGVEHSTASLPVTVMLRWDPDGAGPQPELLVVAGRITVAGDTAAANIAAWNPTTGTWSALGGGVDGQVWALAALPNGDLVAGGAFLNAGGAPAKCLARWNGANWAQLGGGVDNSVGATQVRSLAVLQTGELIVGGNFDSAGGVSARNLASFDGASWTAIGDANLGVYSLAVTATGALVAAGPFLTIGTATASHVASWNGVTWFPLGIGIDGTVESLLAMPNGDLIAGGSFTLAGGAACNNVARWDGTVWSALGSGVQGTLGAAVYSMAVLPGGGFVAAGDFTLAGGTGAAHLARWNGSAWSSYGSTMGDLSTSPSVRSVVALANGNVVAGGRFHFAANTPVCHVARYDGVDWAALGTGTHAAVNAIATMPNGDVVAGGNFYAIGGQAATHVARRVGSTWTPLGLGTDEPVFALTTLPNGDLIAGGTFTQAGFAAANLVARWDGTQWHTLGTGLDGLGVSALATLPNGDVVAAGTFSLAGGAPAANIARWDGAAWSPLGTGLNGTVNALAVASNGDLVAGGAFTTAGGTGASRIARWNGTSWSPLGTGIVGVVSALTAAPNGGLFAGGIFPLAGGLSANNIARWNGTSWSTVGNGVASSVSALAVMPDGDLIASGLFVNAGGVPANRIARWNGASWSALGAGLDAGAKTLAVDPAGALVAGGTFLTAGGAPSAYLARYVSTCPPASTTSGLGCASSGGANTLSATTLPWVDATFRARGTGLPASALVVALTSFASVPQGVFPLAALFGGLSPAGCDLLVAPDITELLATTNGIADSQLFLPNTPPLTGLAFFHQMIPFETDPVLGIVSVTATNSLQLTAGDF
ncbi:MAG: hypothetical protein JNK78_17785 [Planctomycetes bacterium]|nr:hypothetical protein [Planctomycetota bacterium]